MFIKNLLIIDEDLSVWRGKEYIRKLHENLMKSKDELYNTKETMGRSGMQPDLEHLELEHRTP